METEGVIQYRLLGSHPAASGRYHSFGFSGDTVAVAVILNDVVRQHQINLTKYKLDVRRMTEQSGAENEVLQPITELHTYDRIVINVSLRHYADGVAEAAQDAARMKEERLRNVEGMLHGSGDGTALTESGGGGGAPRMATYPAAESADDPHAFARVTALSSKAFPLLPGLQRRHPTRPLPAPQKGICALCEMNCFRPKEMPCCSFSVCVGCLELAKTMITNEEECVVCGKAECGNVSSFKTDCVMKRESLKSEHKNVCGNAGSSRPNTSWSSAIVVAFESELKANMTRLLSQLDVPDPLTPEAKKNRQVSDVLAQYAYV